MKKGRVFLTTGIGSLPHIGVDSALSYSLNHDIPFLPQLPIKNKNEFMVPQGLWCLPGLFVSEENEYKLDLKLWLKSRQSHQSKIDKALRTKNYSEFLVPQNYWNTLGPFLFEIEEKGITKIKLQIVGPITAQMVVKLSDGESLKDYPDILSQIYQTIFINALALVHFFKTRKKEVILFLDEPALYFLNGQLLSRDVSLSLKINELKLMLTALKQEGTEVGLHCCSDTHWPTLFNLPIDYLSFDFFLSHKTLEHFGDELNLFLKRGGKLSLGIIPVLNDDKFSSEKIADSVKSFLNHDSIKDIDSPILLTPSCGLALETIENAEKTLGLLKKVGQYLM